MMTRPNRCSRWSEHAGLGAESDDPDFSALDSKCAKVRVVAFSSEPGVYTRI